MRIEGDGAMSGSKGESVFRVRPAGTDHWIVYRDSFADPVASFPDKAAALAYALSLARHRRAWSEGAYVPAGSRGVEVAEFGRQR
jgi:hypothetical protein